MPATKTLAIAALAALAQPGFALNIHRHDHQIDRRALEVDWVTVWETVYVTAGQTPPVTTTNVAPAVNDGLPTVTSTSIVVVPEVTEAPVAPIDKLPPPASTTLVVSIRPADPVKKPETEAENVDPVLNPVVNKPVVEAVNNETPAEQAPAEQAPVEQPPVEQKPKTETPSNKGKGKGSSLPFSHKRGLAYNDVNMANTFGKSCSECGWGYNWAGSDDGLELDFVPMLWGTRPDHDIPNWEKNAKTAIANGAKAMFSFNEPDHATQSNMSPSVAAAAHIKYMNPYAGGKTLIGAPSITNSGNPNEGLDWLQQFVDACDSSPETCAYDFCNVHWYSEVEFADTLFDHIEKAHKICGNKPVWLTEFAPFGSPEAINGFMQEVIPALDKIDYLHAYSYFMVNTESLMETPDKLSGYGSTYATVKA